MYALYTLALAVTLAALSPYFLLRGLSQRKYLEGLPERLGLRLPPSCRGRSLWVHAVSVGEIALMAPLLDRWIGDSSQRVCLSTTTVTGHSLAQKKYGQRVHLFYFPLDLPWIVRRVLDRVRPDLLVVVETEIWPNIFRVCREKNIPLALVNARLSEKSFCRYSRIRPFMRRVLHDVSLFAVQSEAAARRLLQLGAPLQRVVVTGNIKFDCVDANDGLGAEAAETLRRVLDLGRNPLLVVGSSMPGEEALLLQVFATLKRAHPGLRLLLAPRHKERFDTVARLLEQTGWSVARRTTAKTARKAVDILLLDTLGELSRLYRLADAVFVGGTLVGSGGHNPLEPARYGKIIFFGPHMENFQEIADLFMAGNAAIQVRDCKRLGQELDRLLRCPETYRIYGENAKRILAQNQGAADRTLEALRRVTRVTNDEDE